LERLRLYLLLERLRLYLLLERLRLYLLLERLRLYLLLLERAVSYRVLPDRLRRRLLAWPGLERLGLGGARGLGVRLGASGWRVGP
jgi:hypothetical protein